MTEDARMAEIAAPVGDPARANILSALMGGRALTAKELAFAAAVSPQTTSGHLGKLAGANLVAGVKQGRHRYFRIATPQVAEMLEAIMAVVAAAPARYRPPSKADDAMRAARTCYDHFAGRLGVGITGALCARGRVVLADDAARSPRGVARSCGISASILPQFATAAACSAGPASTGPSGAHTWAGRWVPRSRSAASILAGWSACAAAARSSSLRPAAAAWPMSSGSRSSGGSRRYGCMPLMRAPVITLIGGPTALIEAGGFRLLTDPTFDAPGEYKLPHVTLRKFSGPALTAEQIGPVDAVLLSHDQHADNFDRAGKAQAMQAPRVFTTVAGAQRLGGRAEGLAPSQSRELTRPDGTTLRITATPARHGPAGIEPLSGDVIGFVLSFADGTPPIYITGDTVWYDGVAEVARRFPAGIVLLFAGAARTRGPFNLTMDTNDAIETAHAFPRATIVPVHCEGWAHFTQSGEDLAESFKALGLGSRLRLLERGIPTAIEPR